MLLAVLVALVVVLPTASFVLVQFPADYSAIDTEQRIATYKTVFGSGNGRGSVDVLLEVHLSDAYTEMISTDGPLLSVGRTRVGTDTTYETTIAAPTPTLDANNESVLSVMHAFHPGKHEVLFYLRSNGLVVERTEFEIRIEQIISEPETATVQTQRYDGMIIEDQYNIGRGSYHSFIPQIRSMKPWTINVGNFSSISTVTLSLSRTMAHRKSFITTFPLHQLVNRHSLYEDEIVSGNSHTVNIGNDVWIGADVVLINNITIGDGAVIGSHSVVRGNIPPYAIVYGNPATVQKYRFNDTMIAKLLSMQWWGWENERVLKMAKYRKMEEVVAAWERGEI